MEQLYLRMAGGIHKMTLNSSRILSKEQRANANFPLKARADVLSNVECSSDRYPESAYITGIDKRIYKHCAI